MEEETGRSVLREILPQDQTMEGSTHLPSLLFLQLLDYAKVLLISLLPYQVRVQQLVVGDTNIHIIYIYVRIYIYIYMIINIYIIYIYTI